MKYILITLIGLTFLSCKKDEAEKLDLPSEVTEIYKGSLFGAGDEDIPMQNILIENESDWEDLMTKMNTVNDETSNFSETDIDFVNYMVLAVFTDVKSSGGYSIEINDVVENTNSIEATVVNSSPDSGGMVLTVITQPYHIVKVPKRDKPVIFQ